MKNATARYPTARMISIYRQLILLPLLLALTAACAPIAPATMPPPPASQNLRPITIGVGFYSQCSVRALLCRDRERIFRRGRDRAITGVRF